MLICALVSLQVPQVVAQPHPNVPPQQNPYNDINPAIVSAYFQRVLELLPDGEDKEMFKRENPRDWIGYGVEICRVLARGAPEKNIRNDAASFFGASFGNALADAAKDVICPKDR